MPRKILVVSQSGGSVDLIEVPAENEHELQQVMLSYPQLIPAADLGIAGDLLVIGRETALASGSIDLLCLSSAGEIVIIEFKTGPKNPDFRHALAQVIDYGSDIWRLADWRELDQGLVQRYLSGPHVDVAYKGCDGLEVVAKKAWPLDDHQWQELVSRVDQVLTTGDFHFVVAAQRFTEAMKASVDYLNETTRMGRYFLVELIRLDGEGQKAYAAQVVQHPSRRAGAGGSSASRASEDDFLSRIGDQEYQDAMSELFATVKALGLTMSWGSKGASIRLKSPDREEPISVGWVFLDGDQWTWARHVTLGVDPNTLINHPTVAPAISKFCTTVKSVQGAQPAGGKSNAAVFEPPVFVASHAELVNALVTLTTDVKGIAGG